MVALGAVVVIALLVYQVLVRSVLWQLTNGRLEGADYWRDEPVILAAGMGFDNIIGIAELTEDAVRQAGGAWYGNLKCTNGETPTAKMMTSAAPANTIGQAYKGYADYDDGLPIEFSWPVATETVDPTDFQFTLNTGEIVFGHAAGMNPNWETNERNTVVLFGDFGNRKKSSDPAAIFPVKLEIVADDTPLLLIGPGGQEVSAVGLTWTTDKSPYDQGPVLVGAKLNYTGEQAVGEGGVFMMARAANMPNDEFALYTEGDFRLRVLTSGGFSPDGVTGLRPNMFEAFFRLHAKGADGGTVILDKVGVDYQVAGGKLRVVGLADLGQAEDPAAGIYYDDCYQEDRDNYIDIILVGDEAAARNITFVEIPGLAGGYRAFYNPGGPGPEPFEGVTYTAPGPPDLEPVVIALDDPMRVSRR
ncbi:MAG: phospholipase [Caldilinea sp. CFX5]|nr:phospholipase [Caldilinea sp. CFX5]